MTELKDFKVGEKAYILYLHKGYDRAPEIFETIVKKVGKRYVTVTNMKKQFKRHGNIEGLLEHADFGELGYLFNTREAAETEKKRNVLIHNIRTYMNYLYNCSYDELRMIMDILKKASETQWPELNYYRPQNRYCSTLKWFGQYWTGVRR